MKIKITITVRYFQKNARINQLKDNHKNFVHSIIILKFGEKKIAKEKFYVAKKPIKIWDADVDNMLTLKLIKIKTKSNYLIGYLDKDIRALALIMLKMYGNVKTFKVKGGDKDKNNKLMSFRQMVRSYQKNIKLFGLRFKN